MKNRIKQALISPFLFSLLTVSMILSLPIWLITGKDLFGDIIEVVDKYYTK